MTIFSMTGFGRGESIGETMILTCEIKAVNHRFKDIRFKLPSILSSLEFDLRKRLEEELARGSFDIIFHYKGHHMQEKDFPLDEKKISSFIKTIRKITAQNGLSLNLTGTDFLHPEFLLSQTEELNDAIKAGAFEAFNLAIKELKKSRQDEGQKLKLVILGHVNELMLGRDKLLTLAEHYQEDIKKRLEQKIEAYFQGKTIDQARLGQELIYYLEKLDVSEELNRIKSHLQKIISLFQEEGEVGRQIDFLVQELNREVNTIGAKSGHSEISNTVVQIKVQLEKIREQALNME